MFREEYEVNRISPQIAMNIVVDKHYLHRKCPVSLAFGLMHKDSNKIDGVVTYGVPCSSTLLKGICGEDEMHNVYELNRLWVSDNVPKNGESFLIGNSIKQLDKEIIVSFADTSQDHIGFIYQATNFMYCGLSARFTDVKVKGYEDMHHATYAHGMTISEVREKFGAENVWLEERSRKHRYIYICERQAKERVASQTEISCVALPESQRGIYLQGREQETCDTPNITIRDMK